MRLYNHRILCPQRSFCGLKIRAAREEVRAKKIPQKLNFESFVCVLEIAEA